MTKLAGCSLLTMSLFRFAARTSALSRAAWSVRSVPRAFVPRAGYASSSGLSKDSIQTRIFDVLKGYEKIDPTKVVIVPQPTHTPGC